MSINEKQIALIMEGTQCTASNFLFSTAQDIVLRKWSYAVFLQSKIFPLQD